MSRDYWNPDFLVALLAEKRLREEREREREPEEDARAAPAGNDWRI